MELVSPYMKQRAPLYMHCFDEIVCCVKLSSVLKCRQACLMDASKGSISGLDSMIANLRAMRHRCGNQIESDEKEIIEIDKNIARLSASQKKYEDV
ncbi:hypothetical protein GUITHDRAFT_116333 [Guillardia theta CCMP2712]|uniref:Uncharacterized protein n=1 Tax=Guillardia theta (strain CCMP2712) TaxID=905079 RepID=L1INQ9_GUITC|nr:hypothetical protein GUITHDRAFT_116333 [Guillardia theta CCMP2712]EKX37524.1 hypothetical protein GUITHDRAFT_116333 [Guillardia theta CCMP2712]|eukprot:XP_005824504.1 hypothetical protein GUITHDRAFT_116333 [Guillardia theta CCMP2712]